MNVFNSSVLETLRSRDLIYQISNGDGQLDNLLHSETVVYHGIDPTNSKLHIGNLLPLMIMRWMQKFGHKIIIVLGGATAKIGDPSGKSSERQSMQAEEVKTNIENIESFIKYFFKCDGEFQAEVTILDNYEWTHNFSVLDFLSGIGKNASINRMIGLDSVKSRISRDSYMSFAEFSYSILQAYDFIYLNKKYDCKIQIGGADQWGNIVAAGVNIAKKMYGETLYGITCPLITDANGNKIGKSENNGINIDHADTNFAYEYWQFWRNVKDEEVYKYLKMFTFVNSNDMHTNDINEAKILLANAATEIIYGSEISQSVLNAVNAINNKHFDRIESINVIHSYIYSAADLQNGICIYDFLVKSNLVSSKSEARRIFSNNGIKINGETTSKELIVSSDFLYNALCVSVKNKVRIIKVDSAQYASNQ